MDFHFKKGIGLGPKGCLSQYSPMPCGRHHPEKRAEHSLLKGDTAFEVNGTAARKYTPSPSRRKAIWRGVESIWGETGLLENQNLSDPATDSTSVLVSQTICSSVSCTCIWDFFHHCIDTAKEQSSSALLGGAVQSYKCWCPWEHPSAGIPWSWAEDIQSDSVNSAGKSGFFSPTTIQHHSCTYNPLESTSSPFRLEDNPTLTLCSTISTGVKNSDSSRMAFNTTQKISLKSTAGAGKLHRARQHPAASWCSAWDTAQVLHPHTNQAARSP